MEARTKSIEDWFSMVSQAQIALPRFQRHEAWRSSQIEGILENVLRSPSLPIGALLTLEVGSEELFHSRAIVGAPTANSRPQMHLLDGQQRMTALWRSLNDAYEEFSVFVSLENGEEPEVDLIKRWERKGIPQPVWADDPAKIFERNLIPAHILCPGSDGEKRMGKWCDKAGVDRDNERKISRLRSKVASYPVPFLALPVSTSQETALEVFIKMNTSASPLKDFDIVVAQLEGAVGDSLHAMISDLRQDVPATDKFVKIEDLALSVGALLLGKPPLKRTYLERSFGADLAGVWERVIHGIDHGLSFLQEESVFGVPPVPWTVRDLQTLAYLVRSFHS